MTMAMSGGSGETEVGGYGQAVDILASFDGDEGDPAGKCRRVLRYFNESVIGTISGYCCPRLSCKKLTGEAQQTWHAYHFPHLVDNSFINYTVTRSYLSRFSRTAGRALTKSLSLRGGASTLPDEAAPKSAGSLLRAERTPALLRNSQPCHHERSEVVSWPVGRLLQAGRAPAS